MTEHPVDVWTFALAEPAETILSPDEAERAARFKFETDRVRWIRARSRLRLVLGTYTNTLPEQLIFDYGAHGKPVLAGIENVQFNLSHAGDYALIAVAREVPVGVDIERMRPNLDMRPLLERLGEADLPELQPDLYQRWTIREARSKAAGGALFDPPQQHVRAVALTSPPGYAAAVALAGAIPLPVIRKPGASAALR